MASVLEFLSGKKTYLQAAAGVAVIGAYLFGLLDQETAGTLVAALGFGSIATLRAGISKSS